MSLSLRRLFIAFFVLLQSLAPLLHAHAAADAQTGLHLPASIAVDGHEHHGYGWIEVHAPPVQESIGVANSLEARQDTLCGESAICLVRLPHLHAAAGSDEFTDQLRRPRLAASPPHLLPYPCAPPA